MPRDNRMHKLDNAYHSYHGRVRNVNATRKANVSLNGRVPMNDVSAGHPMLASSRRALDESWEGVERTLQ